MRQAFLRLLRAGQPGIDMVDALDRLGLLSRYLTCRGPRSAADRSAIPTIATRSRCISFTTVAGMASMLGGGADPEHGAAGVDDPLQAEAVNMVDHPDGALLGALFHDIGKVGAGEHVPAGAAIAREQLDAMSLEADDRDLAAFMVAEHLPPRHGHPPRPHRRGPVLDVAARVGTPERLAALYLLAKADARATGPAAWTPWRQALVRELVSKVQRVFERGAMGEELAATLTDRVERVRALLAAEPAVEVDRFVLRMPRGYFLSVEPARAARHFASIAPPLGNPRGTGRPPFRGSARGYGRAARGRAGPAGLLSQIAARSRSPASRSCPPRCSPPRTARRWTCSRSRVRSSR